MEKIKVMNEIANHDKEEIEHIQEKINMKEK